MAVAATVAVAPGDFIRFPGERDRDDGAAVGVLSVDAEAVGDSGGGTVTILVGVSDLDVIGFRAIIVPMSLSARVSADPGNASVGWVGTGNRFIVGTGDVHFASDFVVAGGLYFLPEQVLPRIAIQPDLGGADDILEMRFTTNQDGATYHAHLWALVFDAERLARNGRYGPLAAAITG